MLINFRKVKSFEKLYDANKYKANKNGIVKLLKLLFVLVISATLWLMPLESFGIDGLTVIGQRVIAIFVFAALMWLLEAVPAWTTSVVVVLLLLLTSSDSSFWFFKDGYGDNLGTLVKYKSLMHSFADPIIMLFLGGFILAIAATKSGLDVALAKITLKPFGVKSENVLLGFILLSGILSMFISNTATVAMVLTILAPVLHSLPPEGKGRTALALSIPISANIGGLGTPIGTPPNAIVLKYLNDPDGMNLNIGFGEWMSFMIPLTLALLFIEWVIILKLFPFTQKRIELQIEGEVKKDWRSIIVYITSAITCIMWVLDKYTGVNANTVAMIPIGVFCFIGVITRKDLEKISWSVLWMVAGGFALGVALNESGLAKCLIESIPFSTWPPLIVIIGSGLICWGLSNFISNTASAALLVPILALAASSMGNVLDGVGGVKTILIGISIAASVAMVLPISTPPNALAHATGLIKVRDMEKMGIIIGILGLVIGYGMLIVLGVNNII